MGKFSKFLFGAVVAKTVIDLLGDDNDDEEFADLSEMEDDELIAYLNHQLDIMDVDYSTFDEAMDLMSLPMRTFYITNKFDEEVQNGGLAQYLDNCRGSAIYLEDCLKRIGAYKYADLFKRYVLEYQLDLEHLSYQLDDYMEDYDDFDDEYYEMYEEDPLEKYYLAYVRNNIREFEKQ